MFIVGRKGLEAVQWALVTLVIAIVVLLIFYAFIRLGFLQIETGLFDVFNLIP